MNAVLLIITFAAIAVYEVPKMLSERLYRELAVFACILGLGFITSLLYALGVEVPNPIEAMSTLVNWASRILRQVI